MTVKDSTGQLARWSLLLQQYDFTIHHHAGKFNGNADALSRRPYCDAQMKAFSGAGVQTDVIHFYQRHDTNFFVVILSTIYYSFTIPFWVKILYHFG